MTGENLQIQPNAKGLLVWAAFAVLTLSACAKNGYNTKSLPNETPAIPAPVGPGEKPLVTAPPEASRRTEKIEPPAPEKAERNAPPPPAPPPQASLERNARPPNSARLDTNPEPEFDPPYRPREPAPPPAPNYRHEPLSWESVSKPERKGWSNFVHQEVEKNFEILDKARDTERFCRRYESLSRPARINFWGMLISQMALHESSWNPTLSVLETTMGLDKTTGKRVFSEGLLQLSYQDMTWTRRCKFDWEADKILGQRDPRKTILDPYRNLECGIEIMTRQVRRHRRIVMENNVYWAVLREGGKYNKIPAIAMAVAIHLKACN
ncbi:MAG: hypothetical protein ACK5P7_06170 [Bdellovibrio sp.]